CPCRAMFVKPCTREGLEVAYHGAADDLQRGLNPSELDDQARRIAQVATLRDAAVVILTRAAAPQFIGNLLTLLQCAVPSGADAREGDPGCGCSACYSNAAAGSVAGELASVLDGFECRGCAEA